MAEKILVGVAWPYANGPLHLGQIAGAYLPPDIFARYHRIKGNEVLMVSGSDQHGTPITIRAEQEGKDPQEIASRYHQMFLKSWQDLGITFDMFTTTGTENHARVAQDMFKTLLDNGYIYKDSALQPYCDNCKRSLPDRYVEGDCPFCADSGARGDQCDNCGKPLNAAELLKPRCGVCGTMPRFQESEHFFLKLSAFQDKLKEWIESKDYWRPNVSNFSMHFIKEGLRDRAITRDINWGIPLPLEGYENKRLYVWFEAVIGYLSASKEWAQKSGDPDKWRRFWQGDAKSYYFIGKDNIPFHTIVWPAMLLGYGGLNLPYDVPSNEYLTIEGRKLSSSRNWAIWVPDYISRYDADPLRYLLSANMPETNDTDFSWREFVRRNNDELVATYGNLIQRTLTFVYRNYDGKIPSDGELDGRGKELVAAAEKAFDEVGSAIGRCRFKEAIKKAMALAQLTNRYLEETAPWKKIKEDKEEAARSLYAVLAVISGLRIIMYPFLPFSSQKIHNYLGYEGKVEEDSWGLRMPQPGTVLSEPKPLFTKLDEKIIEEETARLG
jgi:methionyl-tRNA synthetase